MIERRSLLAGWTTGRLSQRASSALLAQSESAPEFRVSHAIKLAREGLFVEAIALLETVEREGYLPATLHKSRALHELSRSIEKDQRALADRFEAESSSLSRAVARIAEERTRRGDLTAMRVLAAMQYRGEGGLTVDERRSFELECRATYYPSPLPRYVFGFLEPRYGRCG